MGVTTWTNGLSSSTGPNYVGYKPTWTSGTVIWVDSASGDNGNDGVLEELPKATLAGAMAVTGTNTADTIIIKSGHTESISSGPAFTSKAGLTIIGLGTGTNRPRFTVTTGSVDFMEIDSPNVMVENIFFAASTAVAASRIRISHEGITIKDCYFQCGSSDTDDTVIVAGAAHNTRIEGCYFISTGTVAAQPSLAVHSNDANIGLVLRDCTFDGGSAGWSDAAVKIEGAEGDPAQYFRIINSVFTGYSDLSIVTTDARGSIVGVTQSGTGSVSWVP